MRKSDTYQYMQTIPVTILIPIKLLTDMYASMAYLELTNISSFIKLILAWKKATKQAQRELNDMGMVYAAKGILPQGKKKNIEISRHTHKLLESVVPDNLPAWVKIQVIYEVWSNSCNWMKDAESGNLEKDPEIILSLTQRPIGRPERDLLARGPFLTKNKRKKRKSNKPVGRPLGTSTKTAKKQEALQRRLEIRMYGRLQIDASGT
jgi:hypothetical protein